MRKVLIVLENNALASPTAHAKSGKPLTLSAHANNAANRRVLITFFGSSTRVTSSPPRRTTLSNSSRSNDYTVSNVTTIRIVTLGRTDRSGRADGRGTAGPHGSTSRRELSGQAAGARGGTLTGPPREFFIFS